MVHLARGLRLLLLTLGLGCAGNWEPETAAKEPEPACSFRSPTTCWSVGGRFPTRVKAPAPQPERLLSDSAMILAGTDSVSTDFP